MNSFDLIVVAGNKAKWSSSSMVVALCHFVDQLHDRLPGTEDDGILGDFERYLNNQIAQERDASSIILEQVDSPDLEFTLEPEDLGPDFSNESELGEGD